MIKLVRRGPRRASRQEPNSIVESSHDAIVGVTREGVVTTWNPAAAQLYGYAPQEIIGRSVEVLYPAERQGEALTDDSHEHVDRHCNPDLRLHRVLAGSEKFLDSEMLFVSFEEQFDLPSGLAHQRDRDRRES